MEKDATNEGVSKEKEETQADPREALVNSILEKNEEDRKQYETDMTPVEGDEPGEGENEDAEAVEKVEAETTEEKKETQEEMVKIVVDGKEEEVPLSQILDAGKRTLQKISAADKRLEEATKLLNEAKSKKPPETDAEKKTDNAVIPKDIVHAINYGTDEEAEEAIKKLIDTGRSKEATPDINKVVNDALTAKEITTKFHLPEDKGGFGDLMEDPYLQKMAVDKVNELLKDKEPNTWETYQKAGCEVRAWVSKFKAKPTNNSFENKKEKKKTIDTVKGANAVKTATDTKEKPKTATDIIQEIQAARPGGGGS